MAGIVDDRPTTAHAALRPASVSVWVREPEERG
jgi:hypothetical protein